VLATFLLDAAGRSLHPGFYSASWGFDPNDLALQFVASLTLTNNLWMVGLGSGSNLPFWSLSYEVWYYALFAAAVLAPRGWRIVASIAVALIAGPRILALFPLWLLGVGAYSIMRRRPPGVALGMVFCFGAPVIWVGYEILAWHGHRLMYAGWGLRGPLMQDYLVGVLFAAHLIGFCAISSRVGRMLERMGGPIRWAAGATFTIYLFHLPVAQFLTTVLVWPPSSWQTRLIIYPGVLAVLFLIASVTERRKEPWRRFFAAVLIPAVQTVKSRS
jgi:peptidoglycan/LPS O-acetylase OafA/YrhL